MWRTAHNAMPSPIATIIKAPGPRTGRLGRTARAVAGWPGAHLFWVAVSGCWRDGVRVMQVAVMHWWGLGILSV